MRLACLRGASKNALKLGDPRSRHNAPPLQPISTSRSSRDDVATSAGQDDKSAFDSKDAPGARGKSIAILGGGITGLSTAFNLLQTSPNAKITIYEASDRFGGWIDSEKMQVAGGEALFEWGPRNLRPDLTGSGHATALLLEKLNLCDATVGVRKTAPAAINRFLYFPDHLVRMPGPVPGGWPARIRNVYRTFLAFFTEPIYSGALSAVLAEPFVRTRSEAVEDESVGDFMRRRFGRSIADNLMSAMFHGIYAGDIYKLSARTLMPSMWYFETRDPEGTGILPEIFELTWNQQSLITQQSNEYRQLMDMTGEDIGIKLLSFLSRLSVYTFSDGLGQLVSSIEAVLRKASNVNFQTNSKIIGLEFDDTCKQIALQSSEPTVSEKYDYVVSSLSPEVLRNSAESNSYASSSFKAACTSASDASTVMVVNLYYANPQLMHPSLRGFGYLLPRSVPTEQNPERALGVIFGSESSGARGPVATGDRAEVNRGLEQALRDMEQEHGMSEKEMQEFRAFTEKMKQAATNQMGLAKDGKPTGRLGQDTARGTKLTVMLGGHWWDDWSEDDLPTEAEGIQMAKAVIARHLMVTEMPEVAKARLAKNAIPQYRVGYRKTMATIHDGLMTQYQGRLKVAGPWWQGGVGINDCVRKAHETAIAIGRGWDERTGLEHYGEEEKWYLVDKKTRRAKLDRPS